MQGRGVRPAARTGAPPGKRLRAVRAALFTALCVTLSAASHVLLSHAPLPPATLAAVCAAVFTAAYAHAGRERGYAQTAALLVPLELAADTVFTTGQQACYGPAGGPLAGPLHTVGVDLLCRGGAGPAPPAALPHGLPAVQPAAGWLLLAAHLTVGLLAAGWLHRGEAALGALLRAAGAGAVRPLRTAAAVVRAAVAPRVHRPPPRPPAPTRPLPFLTHCVRRRGPPFPTAV
ncbi:hypothetical protein [Streptomyces noursei]|uniref:hypothetical protein n=1 Tax=Streptomyces noursei TaxID=1971 RepID=UPI0023B82B43|nr:hypothetical protein [Streptomyces noursei]